MSPRKKHNNKIEVEESKLKILKEVLANFKEKEPYKQKKIYKSMQNIKIERQG